jgi:hypothetical protein
MASESGGGQCERGGTVPLPVWLVLPLPLALQDPLPHVLRAVRGVQGQGRARHALLEELGRPFGQSATATTERQAGETIR